jgi:hypothetical protein
VVQAGMAPNKVRATSRAARSSEALTDLTDVADLLGPSHILVRIRPQREAGLPNPPEYSSEFRAVLLAPPSRWRTEPPPSCRLNPKPRPSSWLMPVKAVSRASIQVVERAGRLISAAAKISNRREADMMPRRPRSLFQRSSE